jgi:formate hydrogenlyase subunit 6/NADH:ubiquinone oxidoreductase subunit I
MYKQHHSKGYWRDIERTFLTLSAGLKITWKHFKHAYTKKQRGEEGIENSNYFSYQQGISTLQYPSQSIPVPDNGRYRLHNEIEDCIVCDKCVKVCPVNCIEIDVIKSPEEIRKASDGSSIRLYAGKFEIDMAKCMFCGLCTTVCPTECLTMTKTYDFSEFDIKNMAYEFSDLTKDQADRKRQEYLDYVEAKNSAKTTAILPQETATEVPKKKFSPIIKPKPKTDD